MLRDTILNLFKDYPKDVQEVLVGVIEQEWAKLSLDNPRGIMEEIRLIIDEVADRGAE